LSAEIVKRRIFHRRNIAVTRIVNEHVQPSEVRYCRIYCSLSPLRQVESLVRPPEDMYYRELKESYRRVRTFLPDARQ
jgi:hypothetical protein